MGGEDRRRADHAAQGCEQRIADEPYGKIRERKKAFRDQTPGDGPGASLRNCFRAGGVWRALLITSVAFATVDSDCEELFRGHMDRRQFLAATGTLIAGASLNTSVLDKTTSAPI